MDRWIDEWIEQTNFNVLMRSKCLPSVLRNLEQSYFHNYHMVIYTYIVLNILPSFIRNRNTSAKS